MKISDKALNAIGRHWAKHWIKWVVFFVLVILSIGFAFSGFKTPSGCEKTPAKFPTKGAIQ